MLVVVFESACAVSGGCLDRWPKVELEVRSYEHSGPGRITIQPLPSQPGQRSFPWQLGQNLSDLETARSASWTYSFIWGMWLLVGLFTSRYDE